MPDVSTLPIIKTATIGSFASSLLLTPIGVTPEGREVGMSYGQVLTKVLKEYPGASTTVKSLAWYNSKMKGEGQKVPLRPRFDPPLPK